LQTKPVLHCGLPQLPFPHERQASVDGLPQIAHNPAMFMNITSSGIRALYLKSKRQTAGMADELKQLLRSLSPSLPDGKYCIGTFDEAQMMGLANYLQYIICIFREKEGLTAVFEEKAREQLSIYTEKKFEGPFALITLQANSPLLSVGLLAKVTGALAAEGIACNAFSAFHHDHLLVPFELREKALAALKKLQKSA